MKEEGIIIGIIIFQNMHLPILNFFLHHWGKPLFILLSSGFSYFGFYTLILFNIFCGIFSAVITYGLALKMKMKYPWIAVIILMFTPLYFLILQSGLTEPLMGLVLVASFYLLYSENYFWGAIIMSFSMYARTEGTFLTVYVFVYLILVRQWKYIPLLGTGFLLYSVIGFLSGHPFLWFFKENPYQVISPYGHGEWMDFFNKYDVVFGYPQTIFLIFGLLWLFILGVVKIRQLNFTNLILEHRFLFLIAFPAILFFMFHVIAWKYGLFGSCGLVRVLMSVAPLFALVSAYGFHQFIGLKISPKIVFILLLVFIFLIVRTNFIKYRYPLKAIADDKVELEVANWFKENEDQNSVIYYAHPGIVFHCNRNPFDKEKNIEEFGLVPENIPDHNLPVYVFWDSQLSDYACGLKLNALLESKKVKLIHGPVEDRGFSVYVFKLIPAQK